MLTTWHSLAWKEWHEHKWKLVSIAAVLMGATSLSMLVEDRDKLGLAFGMMFMCVIPLAVFVGLGIASNERSRDTLDFLQAQPVPLWHAGLVKLLMALVTLIVPIALTTLSIFVWRSVFDWLGVDYAKGTAELINTGNFFFDIAIFCTLLAVSLVIWSAATGINRKDEVSAGAVALAVTIGWSLLVLLLMWCLGDPATGFGTWFNLLAVSVLPCGVAAIFDHRFNVQQIVLGVSLASIVHFLLAAFYVRRFGKTTEHAIVSPKVATPSNSRLEWLGSPRETPLTAIVWKQFRESVPITIAGLAAIVAIAVVIDVTNGADNRFANVYTEVSIPMGFCVALVVGIGVMLQDVTPQANTFWRSRPIDGNLWFWTKFVTGLIILAIVICVPFLLITRIGLDYQTEIARGATFVAMSYLAIYAAAAAMMCLIRHAVYAAILSLGVLTASIGIAFLGWMTPIWAGWVDITQKDFSLGNSVEMPAMVTGTTACLVICTVAAWLAMRNDWGIKGRY